MVSTPDYDTFCNELQALERHFFEHRSTRKSSEVHLMQNLIASTAFDLQFSENTRAPRWSRAKMIGVLFAQPTHSLARAEIIPNMDYFNYRSGRNINFYCAGYGIEGTMRRFQDRRLLAGDGDPRMYPKWMFSPSAFCDFCRKIEHLSRWQYSGETDLFLANARLDRRTQKIALDFSTAVVCNLARMKEDGTITSVQALFEDIFRYAEKQDEEDPTWGFSDSVAKDRSVPALLRMLLSCLPKSLGRDAERLAHFAAHDVSK